eukprot:CAMPEP_0171907510 /NCGR_PEP_ID=MMETSP0993-20121228/7008_1 /TAXON_ID=483369 /ORGANISM="non described non described, Strain CCMP2098" /LENGTH=61 /DNA_ID=CAMNT_0012539751 /DNA_START=24 /DNA_END=206 /DNA_ORIENTATION=+
MPALIFFFFDLTSSGYLPSKSWRVQIKAARSPSAVFWCPGNPQPARRVLGTKTWAKWALNI